MAVRLAADLRKQVRVQSAHGKAAGNHRTIAYGSCAHRAGTDRLKDRGIAHCRPTSGAYKGVRRILVRGFNAPLPPEANKI